MIGPVLAVSVFFTCVGGMIFLGFRDKAQYLREQKELQRAASAETKP